MREPSPTRISVVVHSEPREIIMSTTELIASRSRALDVPLAVVDGDGRTISVNVLVWDEQPAGGITRLIQKVEAAGDSDPKHTCCHWQAGLKLMGLEIWGALLKAGEPLSMPMIGSIMTLDRLVEDFSAMVVLTSARQVVIALLPEELMGHEQCAECRQKFLAGAN
jgi:hypothetical protein